MSRKANSRWLVFCGLLLLLPSCSRVAITGRRQFNLVPASIVQSMSFQSYRDFISQNKLSADSGRKDMVLRVGQRIGRAVEQYCAETNQSDLLAGYEWEFNLVEDPAVNAWAMPGGKVVVYTGLLPVAQNETGLAVVVGHEIAHAIARHGAERMTQKLIVEMGGMALSQALAKRPEKTRELFMQSYNVGTEVGVLLPYSRVHESEADHMGLIFMAMAGYDPHEAVGFWQRMAESKKDAPAPPEFLSTHPADETRIRDINRLIPEAMRHYQQALPGQ
jgi:predicted Zn-dependent protease